MTKGFRLRSFAVVWSLGILLLHREEWPWKSYFFFANAVSGGISFPSAST